MTLNVEINQIKIQLQKVVLSIFDSILIMVPQIIVDKSDLKWIMNLLVDDLMFNELMNNNLNSEDDKLQ